MKDVYIHIGFEKTGTTTLQTFFKDNEALLQKAGFSYLCDNSKPYFEGIGHFPIAGCFHSERPKFISEHKFRPSSEVLDALRKDIEQCQKHVILSCEHFSSRLHNLKYLKVIRASLPGRNVRIICYLRRQDDMALAAFSTMILSGHIDPFSISEVIKPTADYFNYNKICSLWASVFGTDNVIVREFDRESLKDADIRYDFLNLLNIDPGGFRFGEDKNISLDATQLEALRVVNKHLDDHHGDNRDLSHSSQDIRWLLAKYLPRGKPLHSMLAERDREVILSHFQRSNIELANVFSDADFLMKWKPRKVVVESKGSDFLPRVDYYSKTIGILAGHWMTTLRENEELACQNKCLEQNILLLRNDLEDLTQSRSWRITAPMRSLVLMFRHLINTVRKRFLHDV